MLAAPVRTALTVPYSINFHIGCKSHTKRKNRLDLILFGNKGKQVLNSRTLRGYLVFNAKRPPNLLWQVYSLAVAPAILEDRRQNTKRVRLFINRHMGRRRFY